METKGEEDNDDEEEEEKEKKEKEEDAKVWHYTGLFIKVNIHSSFLSSFSDTSR